MRKQPFRNRNHLSGETLNGFRTFRKGIGYNSYGETQLGRASRDSRVGWDDDRVIQDWRSRTTHYYVRCKVHIQCFRQADDKLTLHIGAAFHQIIDARIVSNINGRITPAGGLDKQP